MVLVEAAAPFGDETVSLDAVERLVGVLGDCWPVVLHRPRRYGAQFAVDAATCDEALVAGMTMWRNATSLVDLPQWPVVRAEVATVEEMDRELDSWRHKSARADGRCAAHAGARRAH